MRFPNLFSSCVFWLIGLLLAGRGFAQEDPTALTGKSNWKITPTASVDVTYTDNVTPGRGRSVEDFITRVAPGINIEGKSARASGSLNYQWQQNLYADNNQLDNRQQTMRATGKLELVEQWLFIDASGNISQQAISSFGTQGVGNELVNNNRTETTTWQWAPYIRGKLAGYADYEVRYSQSETSAKAGTQAQYGGTTNQTWTSRLMGATPLAALGWSISLEQQNTEVGTIRQFRTDRLMGTLDYRIDPQVKLLLNLGRESDNFNLPELQRRSNQGYGIEWTPTERTLVALKQDQRSYGKDRSLTFSHRTALSAWRLSDTRSVVMPAQQFTQASVSSAYQLLDQQLAATYQDPLERANAVLQALQQLGLSADAQVYGNLITAQPITQHRQEASFSLTGANNTVVFTLQRSSSGRLGAAAVGVGGDFAQSASVSQSGLSGSWAHKLSPLSSLTLTGLQSRSEGDRAAQSTDLKSLSLLFSTKLGYRTSASAGLRKTRFDSAAGNSYDEQAVTGSLFVSF